MSVTLHRTLAATLLVLGLLGGPGCDKGPDSLQKAEALYADLVQRGVPPTDPAYDAVIAAFEAVPKDSKARAEAEQRLATLRSLRGALPPRPLATPGATGPGTDAVDAQRAACEALARELGATPEDKREAIGQALARCREKLIRLEAVSHPPGEQGHEHGHSDGGHAGH